MKYPYCAQVLAATVLRGYGTQLEKADPEGWAFPVYPDLSSLHHKFGLLELSRPVRPAPRG